MQKYYVVKRGRTPGIYDVWEDCQKQIKNFRNALFKSFKDYDEALDYFIAVDEITTSMPTSGIAVDAAYSQKRKEGEFQIVDINTKENLFKSEIYYNTTVNQMEFLAIVTALQKFPGKVVYSDSATAINWVRKKQMKSVEKLNTLLIEALDWLNNQTSDYTLIKWDTTILKDIPADFFRK